MTLEGANQLFCCGVNGSMVFRVTVEFDMLSDESEEVQYHPTPWKAFLEGLLNDFYSLPWKPNTETLEQYLLLADEFLSQLMVPSTVAEVLVLPLIYSNEQ